MARITVLSPPDEDDPIFDEAPAPYTPNAGKAPRRKAKVSAGDITKGANARPRPRALKPLQAKDNGQDGDA